MEETKRINDETRTRIMEPAMTICSRLSGIVLNLLNKLCFLLSHKSVLKYV